MKMWIIKIKRDPGPEFVINKYTKVFFRVGLGGIGVSLHDISCRSISRYYYLSRLLKMTAILE